MSSPRCQGEPRSDHHVADGLGNDNLATLETDADLQTRKLGEGYWATTAEATTPIFRSNTQRNPTGLSIAVCCPR